MRPIDADALAIQPRDGDDLYSAGWNAAVRVIKDAPTVEGLEKVVYCKDCMWWDKARGIAKHSCCPPSSSHGGYCTRRGATTAMNYCWQGEKGRWEDRHQKIIAGEMGFPKR